MSSDRKKSPRREYNIKRLSVIITLYFLSPNEASSSLMNSMFSDGRRKSARGMKHECIKHLYQEVSSGFGNIDKNTDPAKAYPQLGPEVKPIIWLQSQDLQTVYVGQILK
jgi:hypothetical protein